MNQQPIEKSTQELLVDLHSIFPTIQGEGPFAGTRAVFIRLAGCNLQCPLCDTDYTTGRHYVGAGELATIAGSYGFQLVVITGGEPFRQAALSELVDELIVHGLVVQIETNGTLFRDLPYSHPNLHIVCSPKTGKINPFLLPFITEFKYVLHADRIDPNDGLPVTVLDHSAAPEVARPSDGCEVYVQPVDVNDEKENARHLEAVVDVVMRRGYRLCLQQHKIIGVE